MEYYRAVKPSKRAAGGRGDRKHCRFSLRENTPFRGAKSDNQGKPGGKLAG
jgi:hypothetical protein